MRIIAIVLSVIIVLLSAIPASASISVDLSAAEVSETEAAETIADENETDNYNEKANIGSDETVSSSSASENTENTQPSENTDNAKPKGETFNAPVINKIEDTDSGVKITWDPQIGVYKYKVFIKSGSSWKKIGETSDCYFIYKSAKLGTSYTFTVRTIDNKGEYTSPYNKSGWKHTYYLATPKLKPAEYSSKGIVISWNKVANAKKYRVFYKRSYFKSWRKLGDTTSTSYTDTSLSNNITYVYTVRCLNPSTGAWESSYDKNGVEILYHTIPSITDVSGADTGVKITWKAVTGVKYFKVYYKDNDSAWKLATDKPVTGTSYTYKTNAYRHKITLTVKCSDENGKSISFHQYPGLSVEYLEMPEITSVKQDVSDMTIRWKSVKGAYKYRVFYHNGKQWKSLGNTSSTSFTYSDGYCDGYEDKSGGTYKFTVRCYDKYGKFVSGFRKPGYTFKYTFVPKVQKIQIKCPYFSQDEMKAGCETYATTMLLHFYGFGISPVDFADEFVVQRAPTWYNGVMYGPSMDSAFCGNVYNGWGINAKGMAKCINNYLIDRKSKLRATAYTDKSLQYLCNKYVANGIPVLVWSTSQLTDTWVQSRWNVNYTTGDDNKTKEEWYRGEHCLVLIGYDFPNRRYIYNDSLATDRSVGVSNWAKVRSEDRFTTLGSQSIVIQPK